MITEKQKEIIFNTNCLYQLVGQVDKIENNEDLEMLPEISMYAMVSKNSNSIDWHKELNGLYSKSMALDLSKEWTDALIHNILEYIKTGNLFEYRNTFMNSIELLLNMLNSMALSAPHVPKEHLAQSVVGDIFEKDYWEGETANKVQTVRKLNTVLNFPINWVIEFSTVLLLKRE